MYHLSCRRAVASSLKFIPNGLSSFQKELPFLSKSSVRIAGKRLRSKLVDSAEEALSDCIFPGARIHCGSFGLGGLPETLLNELSRTEHARDLTVVSLTASVDGFGLGKLVEAGKVRRLVSSYVGENDHVVEKYFGGTLEVELLPQGTIAARMRAAGSGIPAFYTPAGAGTYCGKVSLLGLMFPFCI
jgi:acyl CoA:acetate/3-ketoacid CoA transferase alpha subunit